MNLLPLTPAPERLPAGAPPPWPPPALLKPPPAPKAQGLRVIYVALLVATGPLCAGIMIWADSRDTADVILSAAMTVCSVLVLGGAVAFSLWDRSTLPARQHAHDVLLEHMTTCWARVRTCAIVGSESSSEGALSHYVLSIELEPWCDGHPPVQDWQVRWRIAAAVTANVVPGTWFSVAYDRRNPSDSNTQFMQCFVSPAGVVLPLE
ncbi:hypothetical protein ACLEPN_08480 [Myxococcus sp. 1LA]